MTDQNRLMLCKYTGHPEEDSGGVSFHAFGEWLERYDENPDWWRTEYSGHIKGMYDAFTAGWQAKGTDSRNE